MVELQAYVTTLFDKKPIQSEEAHTLRPPEPKPLPKLADTMDTARIHKNNNKRHAWEIHILP